MLDRVPTKPNRYAVYDDAHTFLRYEYHERADEPTQVGDALNKENLLDDNACRLLSLSTNAVPNDAFQKIALNGKYAFAITVKTSLGTPVAGVTITGVTSLSGGAAITDGNGYVLALATTSSAAISITSPYIDVQNYSGVVTASESVIASVSVVMAINTLAETLTFTSTQNIRFSKPIIADVHLIGGGANGNTGSNGYTNVEGGAGGRSGGQIYQLGISLDTSSRQVTIGAGGGGITSFNGISSSSGAYEPGGTKGDVSAAPGAGISSTTKLFGTGAIVGGGSGGGGGRIHAEVPGAGASGGSLYGGAGGKATNVAGASGGNATGDGGGGGGGGAGRMDEGPDSSGGSGYRGIMYLKWRYA